MNHGNQHAGRRADLIRLLNRARSVLMDGRVSAAHWWITQWRTLYAMAPASTRRRWKCGR